MFERFNHASMSNLRRQNDEGFTQDFISLSIRYEWDLDIIVSQNGRSFVERYCVKNGA